ncbi:hypothetical protein C7974DRAFT_398275 [Boeremia exigua]|uniref:uncharacterized protein n=1 Tax=Boeremia exigua TaxID=749465 RepID=UPI001E8CC7D0|nr:uncharacterized protein C7974DRAFT_398275 [Boeremia exigua]KAH6622429.1 hypothetical protein C7974DRAFT_398275 [Boeremia exigua]
MAEDAPTQPADKAQPATFSSFINKSASGKKFAPKAARRRPGATGGAPKTVPVSASNSTQETAPAPVAASNTTQETGPAPALPTAAEPESSNADPAPTPAPAPLLPTPAPTQEPAAQTQDAPAPAPHVEDAPPAKQPPPAADSLERGIEHGPDDDIEAGRSPKRRRLDSPPRQSTPTVPVAVMVPPTQTADSTPQPQPTPQLTQDEGATTSTGESGEPATTPPTDDTPAQPKGRRRTLPWTAVNQPVDGEAVEPPVKKKRAPRGKKTTGTAGEEADQQENEDGNEEEAEPTQTRASARSRGKRAADTAELGEDGLPLPKKPRKPRKDKGKQPAVDDTEGDAAAPPKRKPRARQKKPTPDGDESTEPKRRGRPPREDTPSDAEDHTIDPDAMHMDDLASRNIRVGKLSRREREMRKIDWDAVKQRRRTEDARPISTKESRAASDLLLAASPPPAAPTGPRYHLVDGRIELVHDSALIDRERDADRDLALMHVTEEDDLTTRITARSFMKANRRFPNDFVLPGQGKRWTPDATELFYQGLRSFGTDFGMIAHMFPGVPRRSIKTKFTREERENPALVKAALRGESQLASHWSAFLEASNLDDDALADADAIKSELQGEEARMRAQIDEALREREERDKQRKLAGVVDEGEAEKGEKGRKKRGRKEKAVAFEEGVEIVGEVDEDPNWGVE